MEVNSYEGLWDQFVEGVLYTHRFFNANAGKFLDSVFSMFWSSCIVRRCERPEQSTDITYIRTWQGWLGLGVVLDFYARKVVGWLMKPTLSC